MRDSWTGLELDTHEDSGPGQPWRAELENHVTNAQCRLGRSSPEALEAKLDGEH